MLGFERADFVARDTGIAIAGCNVYLARPIAAERGRGQAVEKVYLTDARAKANGIDLVALLGKDVEISYTKHGKLQNFIIL